VKSRNFSLTVHKNFPKFLEKLKKILGIGWEIDFMGNSREFSGENSRVPALPLFDSIAAVDVADCGKLLVCHVSAQPQESLSVDESRIARFFQQYKGKVDPLHAQAQYMLAAQTGSYKRPEICQRQYVKCPYPADKLGDLLKA